jgi:hypothetical protein
MKSRHYLRHKNFARKSSTVRLCCLLVPPGRSKSSVAGETGVAHGSLVI